MSKTPKNRRSSSQREARDWYSDDAVEYPRTLDQDRQVRAARESRMEESERADEYYYRPRLSEERDSDRE